MADKQVGQRYLDRNIYSEHTPGYKQCLARQKEAKAAAANGDFVKATELLRTNLEWCKKELSVKPMHAFTVWHQEELAIQLINLGPSGKGRPDRDDFKEALIHVQDAYEHREADAPQAKETLQTLTIYAQVLLQLGEVKLAASKYQTLWERLKKTRGERDEETLSAAIILAQCWQNDGVHGTGTEAEKTVSLNKAKDMHQKILAAREAKKPIDSISVIQCRMEVAIDYISLGEYAAAVPLLQQNLTELGSLKPTSKPKELEESNRVWLEDAEYFLKEQTRKEAKAKAKAKKEEEAKVKREAEAKARETEAKEAEAKRRREEEEARKRKEAEVEEARKRRQAEEAKTREDEQKAKQQQEAEEEKKRLEEAEAKRKRDEKRRAQKKELETKRQQEAKAKEEQEASNKQSGSSDGENRHVPKDRRPSSNQGDKPVKALDSKGTRRNSTSGLPSASSAEAKVQAALSSGLLGYKAPDRVRNEIKQSKSHENIRSGGQPGGADAGRAQIPAQPKDGDRKSGKRVVSAPTETPVIKVSAAPVAIPSSTAQPIPIEGKHRRSNHDRNRGSRDGKTLSSSLPDKTNIDPRVPPARPSVSAENLAIQSPIGRSNSTSGPSRKPDTVTLYPRKTHKRSSSIPPPEPQPQQSTEEPQVSNKVTGQQTPESKTGRRRTPIEPPPVEQLSGETAEEPAENVDALLAGKDEVEGQKPSPLPSPLPSPEPRKVPGRFYDAKSDTEGGNLDLVDELFNDIKKINELIFKPHRRKAGKRVKVAILDTGIDMKNLAFKSKEVSKRIKKRVDFVEPGGNATDICGHGTYCAGLVSKIAPEADIYIGRVARDYDSGLDENTVAEAICRALQKKGEGKAADNWDVDVLSLSLGFFPFSEVIKKALEESNWSSKLVLAAASNHGTRLPMSYPASASGVMAINSSDPEGVWSKFNPPTVPGKGLNMLGEKVSSAWITTTTTTDAKGVQTVTEDPGATKRMRGTSVATPIAAGLMALVLEAVMVELPDEDSELKSRRDFLLRLLKTHDGMTAYLAHVTKEKGGNIVPIDVLWPTLSLKTIVYEIMYWPLARRFLLFE